MLRSLTWVSVTCTKPEIGGTIGRRVHTLRYDDESERCSISNPRNQLSDFSQSTAPSTIYSMSIVTSSPFVHFEIFTISGGGMADCDGRRRGSTAFGSDTAFVQLDLTSSSCSCSTGAPLALPSNQYGLVLSDGKSTGFTFISRPCDTSL